jgi:hypothetical protein
MHRKPENAFFEVRAYRRTRENISRQEVRR